MKKLLFILLFLVFVGGFVASCTPTDLNDDNTTAIDDGEIKDGDI